MLKSIEYKPLTKSEVDGFSPKSSYVSEEPILFGSYEKSDVNSLKLSSKNHTSTSTDSVNFE